MRRRLLAVALICVLLAVPFAQSSFPATGEEHAVEDADVSEDLRGHFAEHRERPPSVERDVQVVLTLDEAGYVPAASGFEVDRTYTRQGEKFVEGSAALSSVPQLSEDPRVRSVRIAGIDGGGSDDRDAPGVAAIGADRLHRANVTGENVTVGVIDSDFRVSHPGIADSVGAYRSLDGDDDWRHGTAVASVVVDTAPDARLHLAAIGDSTTPAEYRRAVQWLLDSGADVIVDAGSYYAQPGDGSGEIGEVAADAANESVFVTSAGNHGGRYWAGNHTAEDGQWVTFDGDVDGNYLAGGERFGGRVEVVVRWDDWSDTDTDYDVYLLRDRGERQDVVVARATGAADRPVEHLGTRVPVGRYYVAVRAVDPSNGTDRVELFANRNLSDRSNATGLGAPATADGVLAVGTSENGTVAPFSPRGADLVAPDSVSARDVEVDGGTSFAAPYVAGVAALALGERPWLPPEAVRARLLAGAVAVGPGGVDPASGHGRLNASAAGPLTDPILPREVPPPPE